MKSKISGFVYATIFLVIFILDRATKRYAFNCLTDRVVVNNYLSFDLWLNRGISWGMFHSDNNALFIGVSIVIALLVLILMGYTFIRWMNNCMVLGELLVIVGGFSNIIDRIIYGGVVDFILISCNRWSWPVFNIADMSVVIGVGIMLVMNYRDA